MTWEMGLDPKRDVAFPAMLVIDVFDLESALTRGVVLPESVIVL